MIKHYYPKTPLITSSMAMPRDPLKSTLSPGFRLSFRDKLSYFRFKMSMLDSL